MAITGANRGTGTFDPPTGSNVINVSSDMAVGSTLVLSLLVIGNDVSVSVSDAKGHIWTKTASYESSALGVWNMFVSNQGTDPILTGTNITISVSYSSVSFLLYTIDSVVSSTTSRIVFKSGSMATANTITSGTVNSGAIIIGYGACETDSGAGSIGDDTDTINGSWSTGQTVKVTNDRVIISQRKVVTTSGAQTYNPSYNGSGVAFEKAGYTILEEANVLENPMGSLGFFGI